jgi:hypothetical protein
MPSFDREFLAQLERSARKRRIDAAFKRGPLSPEDRAWLVEELRQASTNIQKLQADLRHQRAWTRRIHKRLASADALLEVSDG